MNDTSLDRQPANIEYVPAGWNLRRLAEISTSIGDGIHSTPNYVEHSRFSFINGNNLVDGSICIFGSTKFVGEDEYMRLRINLSSRTILISINGTIGNLALFQGEEVVLGKSAAYVNLKKGISREFVYYYLASRRVSSFFENELTGTTIRNLSLQTLRNTPILLPSSAQEGNQIGSALGDVEDLIFTLERLIAKQQAIKQGLMQQLLTGKTRVPGFTEPWSQVRLGDHVNYVKTVALSRAQLDSDSPLRYLHYGDIHTRTALSLDAAHEAMPRASTFLARNAGRLQPGDLVFADASEDPDGVGKSVEIVSVPPEGVVPGLHTIAARFDKSELADGFKAYLQFIPEFRNSLLRLAAGTKVLATTRSYISSITLTLPGIQEQRAIAHVLIDSGNEIHALRARLNKARAMKQGMMQELLTGRTRLPVKEPVS